MPAPSQNGASSALEPAWRNWLTLRLVLTGAHLIGDRLVGLPLLFLQSRVRGAYVPDGEACGLSTAPAVNPLPSGRNGTSRPQRWLRWHHYLGGLGASSTGSWRRWPGSYRRCPTIWRPHARTSWRSPRCPRLCGVRPDPTTPTLSGAVLRGVVSLAQSPTTAGTSAPRDQQVLPPKPATLRGRLRRRRRPEMTEASVPVALRRDRS